MANDLASTDCCHIIVFGIAVLLRRASARLLLVRSGMESKLLYVQPVGNDAFAINEGMFIFGTPHRKRVRSITRTELQSELQKLGNHIEEERDNWCLFIANREGFALTVTAEEWDSLSD